jgi:hypothetical protein
LRWGIDLADGVNRFNGHGFMAYITLLFLVIDVNFHIRCDGAGNGGGGGVEYRGVSTTSIDGCGIVGAVGAVEDTIDDGRAIWEGGVTLLRRVGHSGRVTVTL